MEAATRTTQIQNESGPWGLRSWQAHGAANRRRRQEALHDAGRESPPIPGVPDVYLGDGISSVRVLTVRDGRGCKVVAGVAGVAKGCWPELQEGEGGSQDSAGRKILEAVVCGSTSERLYIWSNGEQNTAKATHARRIHKKPIENTESGINRGDIGWLSVLLRFFSVRSSCFASSF